MFGFYSLTTKYKREEKKERAMCKALVKEIKAQKALTKWEQQLLYRLFLCRRTHNNVRFTQLMSDQKDHFDRLVKKGFVKSDKKAGCDGTMYYLSTKPEFLTDLHSSK